MSRPWCIEHKDALCYLLLLGDESSKYFTDEKDCCDFLEAVGEMPQQVEVDIFAYILIHLNYQAIKIAQTEVSRLHSSLYIKNENSILPFFVNLYAMRR